MTVPYERKVQNSELKEPLECLDAPASSSTSIVGKTQALEPDTPEVKPWAVPHAHDT